ncbi:IPT/TIG domain-containing protein, partial [Phaeodactylibacter luteus]
MRLLTVKVLAIILVSALNLNAQKEDLSERTLSAEYVFEGKVIEKTSFWNSQRNKVFTKNRIEVSRSFKGDVPQVVDLITHGGIMDSTVYQISHGVSFSIGQEGVFFCKHFDNSGKGEDIFLMLNGMSGLVLYDFKLNGVQARDIHKEYGNVWQELFEPVEQATRRSPFQYGSNGFESHIENWLEDNLSLFSQVDTIMEFTFQNVQLNGGSEVEFDIFVRSNQDGIKFAASDVFLKYATEAFGSSVIENEKLAASKEDVIENPIYTLDLSDFDADMVKIAINSASSPSELYPISQSQEKFLHVVIDIENIMAIGTISFDEFLMSNESMFYDENIGEYVPFSKIKLSHPTNVLGGPMISDFSSEDDANPHHISAGTGEILTIIGMGFGDTKGTIKFRDENLISGGVETSEDDIEVWTENMIQVKVPSADSDFSGLTAVSGLFSVELPNGGAAAESDDFLFVDYSVYNFRTVSNLTSQPVDLADTPQGDGNADGILEFSLSTNMSGNAELRAIVNQSLCDWNEQTEIKWGLKPSYSSKTTFGNNDQVNLIYFGEESEFTGEIFGLGAYTI